MIGALGIRKRLLLGFALMAMAVTGIALPLADRLIDRQFHAYELRQALNEAHRLELLIDERIDRLRSHASDYGDWSTTVAFVNGENPDYVANNLYTDVLVNFDADAVFIVDKQLTPHYFATTPANARTAPSRQTLEPMSLAQLKPLLAIPAVRRLRDAPGGIGLIHRIGHHWFLIGASSITHPGGPKNKPVHGILGFVTELDPRRTAQISALAGVPFSLSEIVASPPPARIEGGHVTMYRVLRSRQGTPMAGMTIRYPQPLDEELTLTRRLFLLTILTTLAVVALLIWLLVDRGMLSRLERLHQEMREIGERRLGMLTSSARNDEVDQVATRFNRLYVELDRVKESWRHEARHDSLTGLGNRAQLIERIETALTEDPDATRWLCLMLVDLDGFKTVNDLLGHVAGDGVLIRTAERIRAALPPGAQCFRLGGDEFAILARDIDAAGIVALAETTNDAVAEELPGGHALLSASIGIAHRAPDDPPTTPGELMQHADIALYAIKRKHRNGYAMFDDSMLEQLQRYNALLSRLREALHEERIDVHYQPIVDAHDGRVLSFEALARWTDATQGAISPMQFVPMAEENLMASDLDRVVLRRALAELPHLLASVPDASLSLNASVQSLLDPGYIGELQRLIERHGLRGEQLRLEITETAFAEHESALLTPIAALRAQQIHIELDDFGTGHSSIGRLAQIRPRGIKLDRSFVRDRATLGDDVCRAVLRLADELRLSVTAEGVETEADAEYLRGAGCAALQGYLIARPQPLADTLAWLRGRRAASSGAQA